VKTLPPRVQVDPRRRGGWLGALARLILVGLVYGPILGALAAGGLYTWFARGLPGLPDFSDYSEREIATIRAVHHVPLAEFYNEKRYVVPYARIPERLVQAVLATEDASFFQHEGIDLRGILRAAIQNALAGHVVAGGSTITQQVAKSVIGAERSFWRKVKEAILARRLEDRYTKEQILLLYLNRIYLGHNSYGVQAAALNYFRKNVWELTTGECALLAGTIQSPSARNPWRDPEGAWRRADHVLGRMVEVGFLPEADARAARAERGSVQVFPLLDSFAAGSPWFAQAVRERLDSDLPGWREQGVTVWTPADLWLQRRAEAALQQGLTRVGEQQGYRGPLTHLPGEAARAPFDRAATAFSQAHPREGGEPWPVRVVTVDKERLTFAGADEGSLALADAAWAAPWTAFPEVRYEVTFEGGRAQVTRTAPGEAPARVSTSRARKALGKAAVDAAIARVEQRGRPQILIDRPASERVSWQGRLKDLRKAFAPDDVILVRWQPGDAGAPAKKKGKGKARGPRWVLADRPSPEGAVIAVDPATGEVPFLVGSADFDQSQVDRSRAVRQTGSLIKPVLYALAYDLGLAPSTRLSGTPYREGGYNPEGAKADDDLPAWFGLARSRHNVSLRVMRYVLDRADRARLDGWTGAMGLPRPLEGYLAEMLGANETLDGMLNPFCTAWRYGEACPRVPILLAVDNQGRVRIDQRLFQTAFGSGRDTLAGLLNLTRDPPQARVRPEVAQILHENLGDVVRVGTARAAQALGVRAGGKTGTLPFDHWFVGVVDGLVAGVWLGADRYERFLGREKKRSGLVASRSALPIWMDLVEGWLARRANPRRFERVLDGLVYVKVDPQSGLLDPEEGVSMPHLAGSEPRVHKREQPLQHFEEHLWDL